MSQEAFDRISSYYDDLVSRHGHHPRACDYGRPESQARKFAVLAGVMPLAGKRLLDVGCGFADYADYLGTHGGDVQYSGVDISARMIEIAIQQHPGLDLRVANVLEGTPPGQFEVVNANGIFYLLGDSATNMMRTLIRRLFELAAEAVAFNSLSTWAIQHEPGEYYANPLETVEFCRTLTPWVVLRHDYLPHDFTIYMYRQPRIS